MLKLFESIFGHAEPEPGIIPKEVEQLAIERAVDATDARLRALPGYRKQLRPAVLAAAEHLLPLVDAMPPAVELSAESYRDDPRLRAFFASVEHLRQVLREDGTLRDFLQGPASRGVDEIHALMMMVRQERKVLGMELQGERVQKEVAQVAVSFAGHRLLDLSGDPLETTRMIRRRAYDHLLEIALRAIGSSRAERADLKRERQLLQNKLATLESAGWGFPAGAGETVRDSAALERQIAEIEEQLQKLGADSQILQAQLETVTGVLESPREQLWTTPLTEHLDPMGIRREPGTANVQALELQELHSATGRSAIPLRVIIPRSEFPERGDFLAEAQRYLG